MKLGLESFSRIPDERIPYTVVDLDSPIPYVPTDPAYDPHVQESGVFRTAGFALSKTRTSVQCNGVAQEPRVGHK